MVHLQLLYWVFNTYIYTSNTTTVGRTDLIFRVRPDTRDYMATLRPKCVSYLKKTGVRHIFCLSYLMRSPCESYNQLSAQIISKIQIIRNIDEFTHNHWDLGLLLIDKTPYTIAFIGEEFPVLITMTVF